MLALTLDENNAAVITISTGERLKIEFLRQTHGRRAIVIGLTGPRVFTISREKPDTPPAPPPCREQ